MTRALITVDAVDGSKLTQAINTLVQLGNNGNGGEGTYAWTIADQPPGTADVLSNAAIINPTFTPRKEGTYLLSLIVNLGLGDEARGTAVVAVRQMKTGMRIPAAGEQSEAGARGHATHVNEILQLVDRMRADPFLLVGYASVSLTKNDVVRMTGIQTIKSGLPGQEQLPIVSKCPASDSLVISEPLFVVVGSVDGSSNSASSGTLVLLRSYGAHLSAGVTGSAGAAVYVSDTATLSLTPGTFSRRVGALLSTTDALIANNTSAATGSGPRTVENVSGTSYTLTAQDGLNKIKTFDNAAPKTLTVPPDADVSIAQGTDIPLINNGAGQLTVSEGVGVTVETTGLRTKKSEGIYASMLLRKYGVNRWKLTGELEQVTSLTIIPIPLNNPLRAVGTPSISVASAPLVVSPGSILSTRGLGAPTVNLGSPSTLVIGPASIVRSHTVGTPTLTGGAATAPRSLMSTNIPGLNYYDSSIPYLDLTKQIGDWGYGGWTGTYDANGYPASVSLAGSPAGFQARIPAAGQYVALYDGEGTLDIAFGGSIVGTPVNGRYVFQLDGVAVGDEPDRVGIYIRSSTSGNNVRNLRVVPIARESDHATVLLNPQFKTMIEPFQCLRFLDFHSINNTPRQNIAWPNPGWDQPDLSRVVTDWSTRTQPTWACQASGSLNDRGACIELAIDMCNANNSDFWFNIPTYATTNWCAGMAALIAARLNSNLKVYFEFSNEVWNDGFHNGTDIMARAVAAGFANVYDSRFGFQVMMGRYMRDQLRSAIDPARVFHCLASHNSFDARQEIICDYPMTVGLYTDGALAYQHAEFLATGPYLSPERGELPETATDTVVQILAKMDSIDNPFVIGNTVNSRAIADARGIGLCYYECGQHLFNSDPGLTALQTKLDDVNRHENMYGVMVNFLDGIGDNATGPICTYYVCGGFSYFGRWGWKEDMDQVVNDSPRQCPKYDALIYWNNLHAIGGGGGLTIAPASIVSAHALGTPSVTGGDLLVQPASIVRTHAFGTAVVAGGSSGATINDANIFISGHSLTAPSIPQDLIVITEGKADTIEIDTQMYPASTIKARSVGGSDPYVTAVASWTGWTQGYRMNGLNVTNVLTEMQTDANISTGDYTHLVIAENHNSLSAGQYEDSQKALHQFAEQFRVATAGGKVCFYGTWLWITEAHKADMTPWIEFTRDQSTYWECMVSKINDAHALAGRSDRMKFIPMDAALAHLCELATTTSVAGITQGSETATINLIFEDEHLVYAEGSVHLNPVGRYFAACVLYRAIYGKTPVGGPVVTGVDSTQAASLQTIANDFIDAYYTTHGENGRNLDSAARLAFMATFAQDFWDFVGAPSGGASATTHFTQTTSDNPLYSNTAPTGGWWPVAT